MTKGNMSADPQLIYKVTQSADPPIYQPSLRIFILYMDHAALPDLIAALRPATPTVAVQPPTAEHEHAHVRVDLNVYAPLISPFFL